MSGLADIIAASTPSDAEMRRVALSWYDRVGWSFIDRWPAGLLATSIPTKFVAFNAREMVEAFWGHQPDLAFAQRMADRLDAEMGWDRWFPRLNSRSPKDSASDPPTTCAGKQVVEWIMASERCLDDACLFRYLPEVPFFVCLREARHMHKDGEFRCFAKDGEVLGVSRYFYNDAPTDETPTDDYLLGAARDFYRDHLAGHFRDVVFDLYAPGMAHGFLIEINPYGLSDPCCFGSYDELETNPGVLHQRAPTQSEDHR